VVRLALSLLVLLGICAACTFTNSKRQTPYIVAENVAWERLNLYGKEKNVTGFTSDLFLEICKEEEFKVKFTQTTRFPVVDLLADDSIDAVLSTLQPDEKNLRQYLFSDPYFVVGPVLVIRTSQTETSLQDMAGKEVAFERGYNWALKLANQTEAIFHPYSDISKAFDDLIDGRLQGIVLDSMVAFHIINMRYKGKLRLAGPLIDEMGIRLVVKKGKNEELIHQFNHGLLHLKKNGLYLKILRYWDLFDAEDPTSLYASRNNLKMNF
jgi:polar amino acid transport system substrate-binding protein